MRAHIIQKRQARSYAQTSIEAPMCTCIRSTIHIWYGNHVYTSNALASYTAAPTCTAGCASCAHMQTALYREASISSHSHAQKHEEQERHPWCPLRVHPCGEGYHTPLAFHELNHSFPHCCLQFTRSRSERKRGKLMLDRIVDDAMWDVR